MTTAIAKVAKVLALLPTVNGWGCAPKGTPP
jgi:hypothetical protein